MKRVGVIVVLGLLTACGVDGAPVPPKVSATQTIGVNSETGVFNKSSVTLFFDLTGDSSS